MSTAADPAPAGGVNGYSPVSRMLHATVAVLVFAMLALGFLMVETAGGTPLRTLLFSVHKSTGVLVLMLMAVRVLVRVTGPRVPFVESLTVWRRRAARAVHLGLYALLIMGPTAGLLASMAGPYGVSFLGWDLPPISLDQEWRTTLMDAHRASAYALLALLVVHLGAVLVDVARRDTIGLARITPVGRAKA